MAQTIRSRAVASGVVRVSRLAPVGPAQRETALGCARTMLPVLRPADSQKGSLGSPSQRRASDADSTGNVTSLTWAINGHHTVIATDPFGRSLGHTGTSLNALRFNSKPLDARTGLYDYGFRFYEPETQRWLTRDPIGEWGGINLYGFVGNDPMNRVDPYGLYTWREWLEIGGALGGGFEQGAMATADGFIPGVDPFHRFYDPCDPLFIRSRSFGAFGFNAASMAAGGALFNAFGKALASANGLEWASLNAFERFVVSRGAVPVFIANSADVVGAPLAYFTAGGVTVGAGGLFIKGTSKNSVYRK